MTITFLGWLIHRFAKSYSIVDTTNITATDLIRVHDKIDRLTNVQLLQLFELYQTTKGL